MWYVFIAVNINKITEILFYKEENDMKRKLSICISMMIFLSLFFSYNTMFAEDKYSPNLSQEEYEEYKKANPEPFIGGRFISIQKRYTSKNNIPAAVEYSEYTDGYWWSGVLEQVENITIDPITGYYLATFEGNLYKQ
jgi:hypothetical protein